ncbi:MAG: hypothetical protein DHS20C11_38380 [Lysobacteraceae bacterium]|nr:MAG: hypothetical protein DHS20C11_38380 [Xanthomonadaceae bacterium]
MRSMIIGVATSAMFVAGSALAEDMTENQKDSYLMGLDIGESIKSTTLQPDLDTLLKGIRTALDGGEYEVSAEERQAFAARIQQMQRDAAQKAKEAAIQQNADAAAAFLEENASKDGVTTTESGLQYIVLEEGEGEPPAATDQVTVHYTGKLLDGTEFDSSLTRGEPISFALNRVIPGWSEGVQLMKPGAKYTFFIPPALGYGERGAPGVIPPNSALIFDVELISIGVDADE